MKVFGKERNKRLLNACLLMVIGLLMAIFSSFAASLFAYTAGTFFLVVGVLFVVLFFIGFALIDPFLLLQGILNLVIGSVAIANPDSFMTWVFYVAAFFLIYQGALEIAYCVDLKLTKTKNWWLDLVYGVAMIALAIALISLEISQGVGSNILMIVGGCALFLSGLIEAIFILFLHRTFKRFKKNGGQDNDHHDENRVVAEQ